MRFFLGPAIGAGRRVGHRGQARVEECADEEEKACEGGERSRRRWRTQGAGVFFVLQAFVLLLYVS